jgi:cytochrome c556
MTVRFQRSKFSQERETSPFAAATILFSTHILARTSTKEAAMGWIRRSTGMTVITAALVICAGMAALAQQNAIQDRRAAMKANGQALMHIDKILRSGGNLADVVGPAGKIAEMAADIPGLFPAGSGAGDAAADPAIWQKFDDFQGKAASLQNQAALLSAAAGSGDLATVRAQFDKVMQACSDCHKPYRHQRW